MGGICNNNDRDTYYNTHFIKSKIIMYKTTTKHYHSEEVDRVIEIEHDFGSGITVVSNLEEGVTRRLHGGVQVEEFPLIKNTDKYLTYLDRLDNEINPLKEEEK